MCEASAQSSNSTKFRQIPVKIGTKIDEFSSNILTNLAKNWQTIAKVLAIFKQKDELRERCKGVHCVDLGESFPTNI